MSPSAGNHLLTLLVFLICPAILRCQVTADFYIPDTVCAGQPVFIQNLSHGGTSYRWTFCTGNPYDDVMVHSFGNPGGLLNYPHSVAIANDNDQYFSFVTNQGDHSVIRNHHPGSFYSNPVQSDKIDGGGLFTSHIAGIQVKNDNGTWFAIVADNQSLIRMNFGSGLSNSPSLELIGTYSSLNEAYGLALENDNGTWYALVTSFSGNTITRFDFGNSLSGTPDEVQFTAPGVLYGPSGCCLTHMDSLWRFIISNRTTSQLSRFDFGTSLGNNPTAYLLGNVGDLDQNTGITVIHDCDNLAGFVVNENTDPGRGIVRLTFSGNVSGPITGNYIGSIGNLNRYRNMSEMYRLRDTLYAYVTAGVQNSLAFFYFPGCPASTIPFSSDENPVVTYPWEGKYNILLTVNPGQPSEERICKSIIVMPKVPLELGPDRSFCTGDQAMLDAGAGFTAYQWNTGASTPAITVTQSGIYKVTVTGNYGCIATDSTRITFSDMVESSLDTAICYGEQYYAGGAWRHTSGQYSDTLTSVQGCDSILTTMLTVAPEIMINLGPDTSICPGEDILLRSNIAADTYTWQDQSHDSVLLVTGPGLYWLHVMVNECQNADTVDVADCPAKIWIPCAFTPNGDGLNDYFRPSGISIARIHMEIFDRWGAMIFKTDDPGTGWDGTQKGKESPPGVYSFRISWEPLEPAGETRLEKGSITLIR